jgi:hypothetical protein
MAMFGGGRFSRVLRRDMQVIDIDAAALRAGAGIEMNSSTHRRKHAHDIQWDNWIMNDYIRVAVFILMPALLLGLHLCVSYVKITHCVQIQILSFPILLIIHRMVV